MAASTSTFKFRPMLERDYNAYTRIMATAFDDALWPLIYPNGMSEGDKEFDKVKLMREMHDSIHKCNVVVDTAGKPATDDLPGLSPSDRTEVENEGRVVGIGIWQFYPTQRTAAELDAEEAENAKHGIAPGADAAFCNVFFAALPAARRKNMGGNPHFLLYLLATDPAYHRRGVGSIHLKWGLDQADHLGIPAYLEASRYGAPLYNRWGFEYIGPVPIDESIFKGEEALNPVIMIRPAKVSTKATA